MLPRKGQLCPGKSEDVPKCVEFYFPRKGIEVDENNTNVLQKKNQCVTKKDWFQAEGNNVPPNKHKCQNFYAFEVNCVE